MIKALRIAWRIGRAALDAAMLPVIGVVVLAFAGRPLLALAEAAVDRLGPGPTIAPVLLALMIRNGLQAGLCAVAAGKLLETLLSGCALAEAWPPLLPRRRVVGFALLPALAGAGLTLMSLRLPPDLGIPAIIWLRLHQGWQPAALAAAGLLWPAVEWTIVALAAIALAPRTLRLPAAAPAPLGRPTFCLAAQLATAALALALLAGLAEGALALAMLKPGAGDGGQAPASLMRLTTDLGHLPWLLAAFVFATIAAGAAATAWRPAPPRAPISPLA